jgi:hypothetical protein
MPDLSMNLATPIAICGVCAGNARHSKLTLTITIGGDLDDLEATHRQYGLSSWGAQ